METNSNAYFAANEVKTMFKKVMEMDEESFYLSFLFPSFLPHSF
jgi:hypothetical protein